MDDKKQLRKNSKKLFKKYNKLNREGKDLEVLFRDNETARNAITSWSHLYEKPLERLLAEFIVHLELTDELEECTKSDNPAGAFIDLFENDLNESETERAPDDEDLVILALLTPYIKAIQGHFECIKQYNVALSSLVLNAKKGDDKLLFKAIMIDRTILNLPYTVQRIAIAEATGDGEFMNQLSKSVTRTLSKPKPFLDDFRFMTEALYQIAGNEELTQRELRSVLVEDLKLHDALEEDTSGSFAKAVQKRNRNQQELG